MKNLNIIIVLFIAVFLNGCKKDDTTPSSDNKTDSKSETTKNTDNIDPTKASMVEFDVKGDMEGTVKAWYKDNKGKVDYNMEMGGKKMNSNLYSDGQWLYIVTDMGGNKMGIKFNAKEYADESNKENGQIDITSFKEKLKTYKVVGKETILDKEADIYEIKEGNTISVWKEQVPLKMVMGKTTMTAKDFEVNLDLKDDFFTPPQDVTYTNMDDMKKGLENMKDMKDMKNMDQKDIEEMMKDYNKKPNN